MIKSALEKREKPNLTSVVNDDDGWVNWSAIRRMLNAPARSIKDYFRCRRLFKAALRTLAVCQFRGSPRLARLDFLDGRSLWMRAGTSDGAAVRTVFFLDEYRLRALSEKPLKNVVDVGGHIGSFAVHVSPRAERILVFEPVEENQKILTRNLAALPRQNAELIKAAVTAHSGTLRMQLSDNNASHSAFPSDAAAQSHWWEVPCVRLPDVLRERKIEQIDFLKLDCEGAEYAIIESLRDWGLSRISRIAIEYHPVDGASKDTHSGEALEKRLRAAGFQAQRVPQKGKPGFGMLYAKQ